MDAQQELFTTLLLAIQDLGYDVYDGYMPSSGASYPFVYLADSQQIESSAKTNVYGHIYQTIHVWHNTPTKRGTVSTMMADIKEVCRGIENDKELTHGWTLVNADQQIITDDTTNTPLLHGVLEVEFIFS